MLKVLMWGTGSGATKYLMNRSEMLDYINIVAFVDGNKKDEIREVFTMPNKDEKQKISLKQIKDYYFDYVVILSTYFDEIKADAIRMGIEENKIIDGGQLYKIWIKDEFMFISLEN